MADIAQWPALVKGECRPLAPESCYGVNGVSRYLTSAAGSGGRLVFGGFESVFDVTATAAIKSGGAHVD